MKKLQTKKDDRQFYVNLEADRVFNELTFELDKIKSHVNIWDFFGINTRIALTLLRIDYDKSKPECLRIITEKFYEKYGKDSSKIL